MENLGVGISLDVLGGGVTQAPARPLAAAFHWNEIAARMEQRLIFNFRLPPEVLERHLPVPWLQPLPIEGFAVASLCVLWLRNVTVGRIPRRFGAATISSAYRFGVLDRFDGGAKPAVYVRTRYSTSHWTSQLSRLGFPWQRSQARIELKRLGGSGSSRLQITSGSGEPVFGATVRHPSRNSSALFESPEDFARFVAQGVTSYSPSQKGDRMSVVDLVKEDQTYSPLEASDIQAPLLAEWLARPAADFFDSAYRTEGGTYLWIYKGQAG
jgi:hypothetical protein